jgi:hypothetical protein
MSDELYAELAARVAVLDMQVQAQGRILMALALGVPQSQRAALLEMLNAIILNAAVTEGANVARQMSHFVSEFLALTSPHIGASTAKVKTVLALQTALLASAPEGQREAMQHWLSIGSPEELADDALALLPQFPAKQAAPKKRSKRGAGGEATG